jgi:hypothetical protein
MGSFGELNTVPGRIDELSLNALKPRNSVEISLHATRRLGERPSGQSRHPPTFG